MKTLQTMVISAIAALGIAACGKSNETLEPTRIYSVQAPKECISNTRIISVGSRCFDPIISCNDSTGAELVCKKMCRNDLYQCYFLNGTN